MKKLLLYLMALLAFGTVPVDSFAEDASSNMKALYLQTPPDNWEFLHIWWWGDGWGPSGYDYADSSKGTIPDLLSASSPANLGAIRIKGSDDNTYLKVMLPENTTNVRLNKNNNKELTPIQWDKVYTYNSGEYWEAGNAVSSVIPSTPVDPSNGDVISIRGVYSSWSDGTYVSATVAEGASYTFKVKLGTGGFKIVKGDKWYTNANTSIMFDQEYTATTEGGEGNHMQLKNGSADTEYEVTVTNLSNGVKFIVKDPNGGVVDPPQDETTLYLMGEPAGGWNTWEFMKDSNKFQMANGKYVLEFDYDGNDNSKKKWFAIYDGTQRYTVNGTNNGVNINSTNMDLKPSGDKSMCMNQNFVGKIRATIDWANKKISLEEVPDYTKITVKYRCEANGNNWSSKDAGKLNADGTITFTMRIGNGGGFNLLFDGAPSGAKGFYYGNNKEFTVYPGQELLCSYTSDESYVQLFNYVPSLDQSKEYTVTIDYANKTIKVDGEVSGTQELPKFGIFLIGEMVPEAWSATNSNWQLEPIGDDEYVIIKDLSASDWMSINAGTSVSGESRYRIQGDNKTLTVPCTNANIWRNGSNNDDNAFKISKDGTYKITVKWTDSQKTISFEELPPLEMNNFEGFRLIVHYANGESHESAAKKNDDGEWITVDKGYYDRGMTDVGENYDGLGLGNMNFYIETISNATPAVRRYWAISDDAGIYQVPAGSPIKLNQFATAEQAAQAMQMSGANANSRYNVTWDWKNQSMTVDLNEIWASFPNQMYLYCLNANPEGDLVNANGDIVDASGSILKSKDQIESEGGIVFKEETFTDISVNKILELLNDYRVNNKVFVMERTRDGLYQRVFDRENNKDLVRGTKFCIVGRTGQVYNLQTDDLTTAYRFTDDWEDFRVTLNREATQQAAIIDTDEMAIADCFARIRVPNTLQGDNEDPNPTYLISFDVRNFPPTKFKLYSSENNGATKSEVTEFTGEDDIFYIEDIYLKKDAVYYLKGIFEDGSEAWFGPSAQQNVSSTTVESRISKDSSNGFKMNISSFQTSYANLSILWNNGEATFVIEPDGVDKTIKVYFVDRAGWRNNNKIMCYAYSDIGLSKVNGTWDGVQASRSNAPWAGVQMKPYTGSLLYGKVQGAVQGSIYELSINVKEYADGSYNMPKVLFNNGNAGVADGNQTLNLYLVDGGIYSNNSPRKELKDANGNNVLDENGNKLYYHEFPATEYLPRMQYNYMDNAFDQDVMQYPNEYHSTATNTIYVDVPEFLQWVQDADSGHDVAISITYDRDGITTNGKEYEAVGIPGTHRVYPVTIGTKTLLKVDLAGVVIPDNTRIDLNIWPIGIKKNNWDNDFESSGNLQPKHRTDANCTKCTDSNGVTYEGNHFTCWPTNIDTKNVTYDNHCPLKFTNVLYKNGNVYRRFKADQDPVVSILDITKPERLLIVPTDISAFSVAVNSGYLSKEDEVVGNFSGCRQLLVTDPYQTAKLVYKLPKLAPSAEFYIVADYGNTAIAFSATEDVKIRPGNPYTYFQQQTAKMGIDRTGYAQVTSFEGTISWTDSYVLFEANKKDAEFEFQDSEGNIATGKILQLPAHRDDCEQTDNHLTKIHFSFAPGYDNYSKDLTRFDKLKIELRRNTEYDKYFTEDANKPAEIIPTATGNFVTIEEASTPVSGDTPASKGVAYIYVRGYTAGMTTLHIEQSESDNNFHRSGIDIPIRIIPTIESIGLHVNWYPVTSQNNAYYVEIPDINHSDGVSDFGDRLQLSATTAAYTISDGGEESNVLTIHWGGEDVKPAKKSAPATQQTIMRRVSKPASFSSIATTIADVNEDKYANTVAENNLSAFSLANSPRIALDDTDKKTMNIAIQQNGINSPMYAVEVKRNPDITTEVEEILGAEEVAPVYYNLNGVRVDAERLEPGIYVKVTGEKSEKVYVK